MTFRLPSCILAFLAAMHASASFANQTIPAGNYSGGTWHAGEVITLLGSVSVNLPLVVEPGVVVRVRGNSVLRVTPEGKITVNGTASEPVYFISDSATPACGDWVGIEFATQSDGALNHAVIRHAQVGVNVINSFPAIRDCVIEDICAPAGANGSVAQPGQSPAIVASGVSVGFGSGPDITDTVIRRVRGGAGGRGGMGAAGGKGGDAAGLHFYTSFALQSNISRNQISEIQGGDGGEGGTGASEGTGGNGYGVYLKTSSTSSPKIANTIIQRITGGAGATAGDAYGVWARDSSARLDHLTIDAIGSAPGGAAVGIFGEATATLPGMVLAVTNTCLTGGPSAGSIGLQGSSPTVVTSDHNNVFGFTAGYSGVTPSPADLATAPGFLDPTGGDCHLAQDSPLINAGTASDTFDDLDGEQRDTAPDIGADERLALGRAYGDFNNDGCTDIGDFLVMLDYWQTELDGEIVDLNDFLSLLDNWQSGANCG